MRRTKHKNEYYFEKGAIKIYKPTPTATPRASAMKGVTFAPGRRPKIKENTVKISLIFYSTTENGISQQVANTYTSMTGLCALRKFYFNHFNLR